jgi:hypothetical protein
MTRLTAGVFVGRDVIRADASASKVINALQYAHREVKIRFVSELCHITLGHLSIRMESTGLPEWGNRCKNLQNDVDFRQARSSYP